MERWANGEFVGATQEETGYRSSVEVAKVRILEEIIEDLFTVKEEEGK